MRNTWKKIALFGGVGGVLYWLLGRSASASTGSSSVQAQAADSLPSTVPTVDDDVDRQVADSPNSPVSQALSYVRGMWKGKAYELSTQIVKGPTKTGDFGDPLVTFYAPNIYGATQRVFALRPEVLESLIRVQAKVRSLGKSIMIVDTYRSKQRQEERQVERPDLAVSAAASYHPKGRAIDVRLYDPTVSPVFDGDKSASFGSDVWLRQIFLEEGWTHPNPREPWHLEKRG